MIALFRLLLTWPYFKSRFILSMIHDTFISPPAEIAKMCKKKMMFTARARAHSRTHFEYAEAGYGLCVSSIKLEDGTVIKK